MNTANIKPQGETLGGFIYFVEIIEEQKKVSEIIEVMYT